MSVENFQNSEIKEELAAKLNAIREVPIPVSVAGKSTEKVRSSIEAFCTALQAYIDSLDSFGGMRRQDEANRAANTFPAPQKSGGVWLI